MAAQTSVIVSYKETLEMNSLTTPNQTSQTPPALWRAGYARDAQPTHPTPPLPWT